MQRPRGSRQHWLRFDDPEKLFANIESAGLEYDSSWGWAGQLGFRNGAAFAFPPYNFGREEACNFLLIPLVIMDQGLQNARRESPEKPGKLAASVLDQSRRWGWGGVSVLWHNPVEPLSACDDVNQMFWQQLRGRAERQERWISAEEFIDISLPRFQRAGLLSGLGRADSGQPWNCRSALRNHAVRINTFEATREGKLNNGVVVVLGMGEVGQAAFPDSKPEVRLCRGRHSSRSRSRRRAMSCMSAIPFRCRTLSEPRPAISRNTIPRLTVIHSTVAPGTTRKIHEVAARPGADLQPGSRQACAHGSRHAPLQEICRRL